MTAKQEIREIATQRLIENMKRICEELNSKTNRVKKGEKTELDDQLELWSDNVRTCAAGLHSAVMNHIF
jgi:hypothetical protein